MHIVSAKFPSCSNVLNFLFCVNFFFPCFSKYVKSTFYGTVFFAYNHYSNYEKKEKKPRLIVIALAC